MNKTVLLSSDKKSKWKKWECEYKKVTSLHFTQNFHTQLFCSRELYLLF